jgi:hypothetical protein
VCDKHCLGELGVLDPSLVIDADELHPYFVPAPVSEGGGGFPRDGFCLSAPTPWALSPEHLFDYCLAVHAAAFIVATPLPGERHWDLLPRVLNSKGSLESGALVGFFFCGKHALSVSKKLIWGIKHMDRELALLGRWLRDPVNAKACETSFTKHHFEGLYTAMYVVSKTQRQLAAPEHRDHENYVPSTGY